MWVHVLNPVILQLGFLQIRWYGVMYVLAFLATYLYARSRVKSGDINVSLDDLDWLLIWATGGLLVGARVFEVLVYNPSYYAANFLRVFAFWRGGLSFHGGLLGVVIVVYFFCRKKSVSFLRVADILIVPLALGQAFGRMGNFINGELVGRVTDVAWGVVFPGVDGARHPSQLYEALYDVIIFSLLFSLRNKKLRPGMLLAYFLMLYAVFRSVTEVFRVPDYYVGFLTIGQFLNVFVFLGGVFLLWWIKKH